MSALDVKAISPILKKVRSDSKKTSLKQSDKEKRNFQRLRAAIKRTRNSGK